jgi:hypothetical protein
VQDAQQLVTLPVARSQLKECTEGVLINHARVNDTAPDRIPAREAKRPRASGDERGRTE